MDDKKPKKIKSKSLEEIEKKVDELEQRATDLEDKLKRAVADYRNLEKRFEEEKREIVKFANKDLLGHLLPAFDTLFLAGKFVQDEGVKLTIRALLQAFEQVGVTRIETENKEYDPSTMECVSVSEGEENKVLEELRPGFLLHGKVVRPAHVKVGRTKKEEKQNLVN